MIGEAPGPVNFTQMVMLFAEKMAGGKDKTLSEFYSYNLHNLFDMHL